MAISNQKNHYLKTQVETASKEQLVVLLFDGIVRFTEQARKAIAEQAIEDAHNSLMRAQAIIMELICTIDREKGGEVAQNLLALHAYAFNCLVVCNMKKDVSKIDEVQNIYRELRIGWVGAMDALGISASAARSGPAAPPAAAPAKPPVSAPPALSAPAAPAKSPAPAASPTVSARENHPAPVSAAAPATGYGLGKSSSMFAPPGSGRGPAGSAAPFAARQAALRSAYAAGAGGL